MMQFYDLYQNRKNVTLLILIPLSEIKSMFYESNEKVSWYIFSDHKKFICNVLEEYSNCIVIGVFAFYTLFVKLEIKTKKILFFLFIINAIDFVFLGLMDNYLYLLKIPLSAIIYAYGIRKVSFQRS